ncbi:GntR family transcriptional regulator [Companilactobacillus halodurans]|uniref:GntR family transcriptional regulator n=1 Tax=Companilactobacillus halodurans TaxID=2584183 RepID=A0A5P0ZTT4_9LACO|nr:GntR family transcriptional regulator [Companilactobacillus halodurans]MQS75994.1 GntR family transcriptional regulator [Companilactobacillus halodurans]MQS96429.1 GntR family transcriptional regulator [Companilactobacillus halodurans]
MAYKYKEVADKLRQQIKTGKYAPGELMPDQNQMARNFGTTRITVHKAIQQLVVEGMVYSKRGAGTFVRKDYKIDKSEFGVVSPIDKPLGATRTNEGKKVTSKIVELSARIPTKKEAEQLLIPDTEPVYVIRRVRYVNKEVFAYEHTIMPTSITTLTDDILKKSIYGHLQSEGLSIEGSHRVVSAKKADQDDIKTGIAKEIGEPVLVINQLSYLDDGQPFEISESHFPYEHSQIIADVTL